jgi:hypothetical protein
MSRARGGAHPSVLLLIPLFQLLLGRPHTHREHLDTLTHTGFVRAGVVDVDARDVVSGRGEWVWVVEEGAEGHQYFVS